MPQTCKSSEGWLVRKDRFNSSGERVSNTWAICPADGDNLGKPGLIPDTLAGRHLLVSSWPERVVSHTGTETRPRLLREAAVGNFGQWAQA